MSEPEPFEVCSQVGRLECTFQKKCKLCECGCSSEHDVNLSDIKNRAKSYDVHDDEAYKPLSKYRKVTYEDEVYSESILNKNKESQTILEERTISNEYQDVKRVKEKSKLVTIGVSFLKKIRDCLDAPLDEDQKKKKESEMKKTSAKKAVSFDEFGRQNERNRISNFRMSGDPCCNSEMCEDNISAKLKLARKLSSACTSKECLNSEEDPTVANDDEAFFKSLIPTVAKFNEQEKMVFRMAVLNVMAKIMFGRS